jgi:uncharacterized membrane protein
MRLRFTKYGFINALWSLIPLAPLFSLFPGVLTAMAIGKLSNDCETGYRVVLWASGLLIIILIASYAYRLDKILSRTEKDIKLNFGHWSLILYTLSNTFGLIIILGVRMACHGDGQTILACFFSGPIASLTLFVFGILMDIITTVASISCPQARQDAIHE